MADNTRPMPYQHPDPVDGPIGQDLWARADRALPGGGVYFTRSADMAGRGVLPGFIATNDGCRVVDVDGREYIDFLGANGPNILGYRHPEVEAAADAVRAHHTTASLFPPTLVEVVERILATWTDMDWGLVAKNGSEVVTLGARVARQATGRRRLVGFDSAYHGNDPELASSPPSGPLEQLTDDVHRVPWNDPQRLLDHMEVHGSDVAAIVMNPLDQRPRIHTEAASPDFISAIAEARDRWGSLIVFDDVRHCFRLHPQGSHRSCAVEPDLIALGKALGNGHSISALLGAEEHRRAARKILFTSTYMFEAPPMAAAVATLDAYERDGVFDHIEAVGHRLCDGLRSAAAAAGQDVVVSGPPAMPTLLFADDPDLAKGRAFARHAAGNGAIFHPLLNWNLSGAHTAADIDAAVAIAADAFAGAAQS